MNKENIWCRFCKYFSQ